MDTIGIILLVLLLYAIFTFILVRFGRFVHQCDDQIHEMFLSSQPPTHVRSLRKRRKPSHRRHLIRRLGTSGTAH